MSAPRYYLEIGLTGTDLKYRMKLKTRVGDHKGLQKELDRFSETETWEKYSESFVRNSGGIAKMEREWKETILNLLGMTITMSQQKDIGNLWRTKNEDY